MNAWAAWSIGRPDEALDFVCRGVVIAEGLPLSLSQAMACHVLALTHLLRAEPSEAAAVARLSADLVAALDFPFWHGPAEMELARPGAARR